MTPHYSILLQDKTIICFCCCGMTVSLGDVKILEEYNWFDIQDVIK